MSFYLTLFITKLVFKEKDNTTFAKCATIEKDRGNNTIKDKFKTLTKTTSFAKQSNQAIKR